MTAPSAFLCSAGHETIPGTLWTPADADAWRAAHVACTATPTAPPPDPTPVLLDLAARLSVPAERYPGGIVCALERIWA